MAKVKPGLSAMLAAIALTLCACAPQARDIRLSDVDLSDAEAVLRIRARLEAPERAYFATYVVRHVTTSTGFCGRTLAHADGSEPRTIGEAIDLTVARSREEALRPEPAAQVLAPPPGPLGDVQDLMEQRRQWADAQANMIAFYGQDAARSRREWAETERRLAMYDERLARARAALGSAPVELMIK